MCESCGVGAGTMSMGGKQVCLNCAKVIGPPTMAPTLQLGEPGTHLVRIICVGHGTWRPEDSSFPVPRNVTVRFRVPDGSSTFGNNDKYVRPEQDLTFGKRCPNYRLWPLTGNETTQLPLAQTSDATEFIRGWRAKAGAERWIYVNGLGSSVTLAQIVYGLGGAASSGGLKRWEVLWFACREHMQDSNVEFAAKQKALDGHGVTLV